MLQLGTVSLQSALKPPGRSRVSFCVTVGFCAHFPAGLPANGAPKALVSTPLLPAESMVWVRSVDVPPDGVTAVTLHDSMAGPVGFLCPLELPPW